MKRRVHWVAGAPGVCPVCLEEHETSMDGGWLLLHADSSGCDCHGSGLDPVIGCAGVRSRHVVLRQFGAASGPVDYPLPDPED